MFISTARQGQAAADGKGTIAEETAGCLPLCFWAVREDRADCHKTLWSAIENIGGARARTLIFHGPLAKRFIFSFFPTGGEEEPESETLRKESS